MKENQKEAKTYCENNDNEISQDSAREIFNNAMKKFTEFSYLFKIGYFLPDDIFRDLTSASKFGSNDIKISALKLLACFALRDQVQSMEPFDALALIKQAEELGDRESATWYKNITEKLLNNDERDKNGYLRR
jgi:hypothetical protein